MQLLGAPGFEARGSPFSPLTAPGHQTAAILQSAQSTAEKPQGPKLSSSSVQTRAGGEVEDVSNVSGRVKNEED